MELLANFTNPAGLVTEALTRYAPEIASVGVCNVGITTKITTGDPTGREGLMVINTFDNTFKIYADGAWRTLTTG